MIGRRSAISGLGAALLAPAVARAQPGLPRVAILSSVVTVETLMAARDAPGPIVEPGGLQNWSFFFAELHRQGYRDGQTVALEMRSVAGQPDPGARAAVIREVVATGPDVIVAHDSAFVRQVMAATTTIPIVAGFSDPIEAGIVRNLARPEANVTGVGQVGLELEAKRMQMLVELAPWAGRVAYAGWRSLLEAPGIVARLPEIAASLAAQGIEMVVVPVEPPQSRAPEEADRWYRELVAAVAGQGCRGMVYRAGPFGTFTTTYPVLARLLLEAGIATNGDNPAFVRAGGLMAYVNNTQESFADLADTLIRILEGAAPADVPFRLPSTYDLFINARTAGALGLTIPPGLQLLATEIIE